jgi:methionyl-tRNA formyltransferase
MRITFLSDAGSWKNPFIAGLAKKLQKKGHRVSFLHDLKGISRNDILFILGFFKIVPSDILKRNKTNIVIHESSLPKGRGWSPMSWLVVKGAREIPLTLFEAVEKVDAGWIYLRDRIPLKGTELLPEIRAKVGPAMMRLCEKFVASYPSILARGVAQEGKPSYYRRRNPVDSRLDPKKSLVRQFNLLRSVDNGAYPAFFDYRGSTFILKIEKKN